MSPYITCGSSSSGLTSYQDKIFFNSDTTTISNKYFNKIVNTTTSTSLYETYCSSCVSAYYHDDSTGTTMPWGNYIKAAQDYTIKRSWCSEDGYYAPPVPVQIPLSEQFRRILQSRQTPLFISSRTPIRAADEERELRARQTLRKILGDDGFQRFLRNGFVSVRANSGKVYQIYPGHGMTVVYDRGTPIEKLCVVLRGDFTPTDSLITRYVMIMHDEARFRTLANVWSAPAKRITGLRKFDARPLTQIFQSLKDAA